MNLYQQDTPSELWIMEKGVLGPLEKHPYRRARLRLEEVLACNGNCIKNLDGARRFWPDDCNLGVDDYAVDPETTARAHDIYEIRRAAEELSDETPRLGQFKAALFVIDVDAPGSCNSPQGKPDQQSMG